MFKKKPALTRGLFFKGAGIIALILQQRPDLTWRDVKHVIAKGSVPIDTSSPSWTLNGGGYRHSYQYGFGLMKVPSLLLAAQQHVLVPTPFKAYYSELKTFDQHTASIPFNWNHTVRNSGISFIEHVILYVGIAHEMRGNVQIKLKSPHGTESVLATERPKDVTFGYPQSGWKFSTVRFWGEHMVDGVWQIIVDDTNPRTRGRGHFNGYELIVYGY